MLDVDKPPDRPIRRPLVEVVCCTAADCSLAEQLGADRIELCRHLSVGGLTPDDSALAAARSSRLPVIAMVRPRAGSFVCSPEEFAAMQRDMQRVTAAGVAGVVFGLLDDRGGVDRARCAALQRRAAGRQTVFHRAFDELTDAAEGLETLIDLGFTRVLTSGGRPSAADGVDQIARLVELARGRIEVLPGGGVRAENAIEILRRTGCTQLHLGPRTPPPTDALDTTALRALLQRLDSQF